MSTQTAEAYWVREPGVGELSTEELPADLRPGCSLVRTRYSGVSVGLERTVGLGRVPEEAHRAMACRSMGGSLALPVKFGQGIVGVGEAGELEGRTVFVSHPHQTRAHVRDAHATVLPAEVPPARATLVPAMELALNAMWDADLTRGNTEEVVVLGAGAAGLAVAYVVNRTFGVRPAVVEVVPARRELAETLPFVGHVADAGEYASGRFDVAFHTSGQGTGLQEAIELVGFEGHVIEMSWYGSTQVTVDLSSFHLDRKRLVASQVNAIAKSQRGRSGPKERMANVLTLLDDASLDALLGDPTPFAELPQLMRQVYEGTPKAPAPLVSYG